MIETQYLDLWHILVGVARIKGNDYILKQIERYSKYMQNSSDIDTIISIYN
jgi:hypothetical protein